MTTRVHSELRKLALAYYRGWIPRDKYLQIRQEYLQYITDGKIPEGIDPKRIAPPKKKPAPSRQAAKGNNRKLILVAVTVVVLALIIAGLLIGKDTPTTGQEVSPTISETRVEQQPETRQAPKTDEDRFNDFLKEHFLGQRTWEQDSLNTLKLKWLGLSQEQQKTVSAGSTFQDFSSALIERIVDERELNNVVPSDYELSLMTVAKNMGMMSSIPDR